MNEKTFLWNVLSGHLYCISSCVSWYPLLLKESHFSSVHFHEWAEKVSYPYLHKIYCGKS